MESLLPGEARGKRATGERAHCPKCGESGERIERSHGGPHFGKRHCQHCGTFLGWAPWPRSENVAESVRMFEAMAVADERGDDASVNRLRGALANRGWRIEPTEAWAR